LIENLRGYRGNHILFRPLGLTIFSALFARLQGEPQDRFDKLKLLPNYLEHEFYHNILWEPKTNRIITKSQNSTGTRCLLAYLLGVEKNNEMQYIRNILAEKQRCAPSDVELPTRFIR